MTNLLYSLCNHATMIKEEEKDSHVWQKLDPPPTSHDMVEVSFDYHGEGIVKISLF